MYKYIISENLKTKRTFARKVIFLLPILTAILAFFLMMTYFQVDLFNWWYTALLEQTVCLEGIFLYRIDGKMKNRSIIAMPVDLKKIYIAKILVGVKNICISCLVIFMIGVLSSFIFNIFGLNNFHEISIISMALGSLVMIITTIFQLPVFFFIGKKLGLFISVIIVEAISLFSVFMAPYKTWIFNPFSYVSRALTPIIKILPNGLYAVPSSITYSDEMLEFWIVPFASLVCLILFFIISFLVVNNMKNKEAV
ncbi:lantibiotic immunity ABC transporter MutE/EpiE family permease subunit [Clostridium sp. BJN0001]|uniref:lantibiotic immunity ABC transporter MutE/EpiE family permease subunit n=1 Tax=Clostridium sp. BJN0001 TaxID=2930219 RepID=UPI001FD22DC5|nr:lantibiotic immunity ABC transporter MutE/EpiE family permease subunit [Clostridium sp. BJN0001]